MLTDRDARRLVRAASSGERSAMQPKANRTLPASVRAVQRVLAQTDWLMCDKMLSTMSLIAENKRAHVAWAKSMLVREAVGAIWASIIFSDENDEKKWNLDGLDGFMSYLRDLCRPPRMII